MTDPDKSEKNLKIPWLRLTGESYHIPEQFASELAGIVIEWGRFEMTIVSDTSTMMAHPNIRKLADEPPRSFKKKIELWKRCIDTLYPGVPHYRNWAKEICSKGKIVARHRHRLIHGLWAFPESKQADRFRIVSHKGLDKIEEMSDITVDVKYLAALHGDIRAVTSALVSLMVNRMWHAHQGLLKAVSEPKP